MPLLVFAFQLMAIFNIVSGLMPNAMLDKQNEISERQENSFKRFQTHPPEVNNTFQTMVFKTPPSKMQNYNKMKIRNNYYYRQVGGVHLNKKKQRWMKRSYLLRASPVDYKQHSDNRIKHTASNREHYLPYRRLVKTKVPSQTRGQSSIRLSNRNQFYHGKSFQSHTRAEFLMRNKRSFASESVPTCELQVGNHSKTFFQSQLMSREPDFIQFHLSFCGHTEIQPSTTRNVFKPLHWYWTYKTTSGPFPFLSWNLDYGILSFGLLDAKTINIDYVCIDIINTTASCNVTFGEYQTSKAVTTALKSLVNITEKETYYRYPVNFFCYLLTRQNYRGTISYWAAKYFIFPVRIVYYECCSVTWKYTSYKFEVHCPENGTSEERFSAWAETRILPYLLGLLILFYFPIIFLDFGAWFAKDEKIFYEDGENLDLSAFLDDRWLFADGTSPLVLGDLLSFKTLWLENYSVTASRIRRLFLVILFPTFVYLEIIMYAKGIGMWSKDNQITVKELVEAGAPMGFLSIFANNKYGRNNFVPLLGGPMGVIIIYYIMGLVCIVFPRSLKQIVNDGLPSSNLFIKSPLFFGADEIIEMSLVNVKPRDLLPGYTKVSTLTRCRFYMLFTSVFWRKVWSIQKERLTAVFSVNSNWFTVIVISLFLPVYASFCLIEVLCCLVFNALPFCTFVASLVGGGLKSLRYLRGQNHYLYAIFKYRIPAFLGASFVSVALIVYSYVAALIFIATFSFISKIVTYCFVAIVIYPSVSFGYLFFFVMLLYYFIKLFRDFGDGYTELLSIAVDISRHLSEGVSVSENDGKVVILNLRADTFESIRINGKLLDVSQNTLQMLREIEPPVKIRERNNIYGIPTRLFNTLVRKHRPVHQQVLTLCFKSAILIFFVILTLNISSNYVKGPNTQISEVMHVIFIVVVGVLPKLVEAALSRSDTGLIREIRKRDIQTSVINFWNMAMGEELSDLAQ